MSLGFAIVGCGLIGEKRLRGLGKHRLKIACDSISEKSERLSALAGHCDTTTDVEAAVSHPEVNAVLVATPNSMLAEIAVLALEKGKHVFVEKPGATSLKDLRRMQSLAEEKQLCLWVGFNHRYHPAFGKARELFDSNELGPLMFMRGRYGHGGRVGYDREWRADPKLSGGGELIDQGVHLIDLSRWFLGDFSATRGRVTTSFWDMPVEDNAFLELTTATGQVAWLHASCSEWKNLFSLEIYGRLGKLEISGLGGSYGVERLAHYRMLPEMGPPETTIYEFPRGDSSWELELQDFARAVESGNPRRGNGQDAVAVMEIVEKFTEKTDARGFGDYVWLWRFAMIITRSPLRITLGGGGTDLPSYYEKHCGFLIAAAIDRYVYINLHQTFERQLILKYSEMERVQEVEEVRHPIIREALRMMEITHPRLEITSMADIPARTGLGSSGSFTTALLKALHAYRRNLVHPRQLAEQACDIEMNRLKEPVGKQDQYIAAYGGITCFRYLPDGKVEAWPLKLSDDTRWELEENLLLFFTGFSRSASAVLKDQDDRSRNRDTEMMNNLHFIKELAMQSQEALEKGNLQEFAELMHVHWEKKRERSKGISNDQINEVYDLARKNGALGGKLVGAGGGGFLLLYAEDKSRLRTMMRERGLEEVRFRFDLEGTKVVAQ